MKNVVLTELNTVAVQVIFHDGVYAQWMWPLILFKG